MAREILGNILDNVQAASGGDYPLCQDTGLACVFIRLGQDVHISGDLTAAVDEGVRAGLSGRLSARQRRARPAASCEHRRQHPRPAHRGPGVRRELRDHGGAQGVRQREHGALKMLRPSDGAAGVRQFVLDTVKAAGPNPCPPIVVGVGVGGSFDKVALCAKRALLRPLGQHHPDPAWAAMEEELLEAINALGIGPQASAAAPPRCRWPSRPCPPTSPPCPWR